MSNQVNLSPDSPYWTKIINHICIDFILGRSSPSPFPLNSSPSSAPPPPKLYTKKWQNTIIDHHLCVYILASWLLGWKVDRLPKQWNNLMEKKKSNNKNDNYNLRYIDMLVKTLLNLHVQKFPTSKKSHMSLAT